MALDDLDRLEHTVPDGEPVIGHLDRRTVWILEKPTVHPSVHVPRLTRGGRGSPVPGSRGGPRVCAGTHFGYGFLRTGGFPAAQADVAQLVERNLAKVEVASSSLVVRSEKPKPPRWVGREARQRTANPSTRVQIPYPPQTQQLGRLAQR